MDRSKVAEEVKVLREKGKSWGEVSKELQARGIIGPRSGKPFTSQYLSTQFGKSRKAKKAPQAKAAATKEAAPAGRKVESLADIITRVQADLARVKSFLS